MKQLLLYLSLLCSCAIMAQEQKYILLDSLTARYDTKKYTFSTLPYGSENTIELYNVFFKDYLLLISVLPDYERNIWQEISFKSIQNNILSTKDLFKIDFGYVRAVKKEGNKYFSSEFCNVERFLFSNKKIEKKKEDKCALLDFQQQIFPFDKMRNIYKKRYPNYMFPLDQRPYQSYEISYNPNIPNDLKGIYLSSIEYIEGYKVYYFYKLCNNRGIGRFAYIKGMGVIAGSFDAHFSPWWNLNRDWFNNILSSKEYLWAEELKKEWAEKEKAKK